MAKKKQGAAGKNASSAPKQAQPAAKKTNMKPWIIAAVVVVVAVGALIAANSGSKGGSSTAGADPAEAKYIGRLLPKGYEEPKVADLMSYTDTAKMTPVTASDAGSATLSISQSDVVNAKIVSFSYTSANGGKTIPLLAYVKPSGKLFVGVSFCPPCEGEGQRLESDITLTCESCGTKRNAESGVGISGACKLYPIDELPAKVANGKITIEKSLLDNWTPQPKDRQVG